MKQSQRLILASIVAVGGLGATALVLAASESQPRARTAIPATANPPFDRIVDLEVAQPHEIGSVFEANYDFPSAIPPGETLPWATYDYRIRSESEKFLKEVLDYALEDQGSPPQWAVHAEGRRRWYHMPWMGPGDRGREFTHGFTPEHRVYLRDLGMTDYRRDWCRQTWAISYFNPVGAYKLGQIWDPVFKGKGEPDLGQLPFDPGTVVIKLLYTQATADEVKLLKNAPEVRIRVFKDDTLADNRCPTQALSTPKEMATLRLLQFDVAVRVPNGGPARSGWVYGTFVYDREQPGGDPWKKLVPVGLMWGNDEDLEDLDATCKSKGDREECHRDRIKQGFVFNLENIKFRRTLGREGRLNGPLDDPKSACMSCHMAAQTPSWAEMKPPFLSGVGDPKKDWEKTKPWFRNLAPMEAFGIFQGEDADKTPCSVPEDLQPRSTDLSLQLAAAVQNYHPPPDKIPCKEAEHGLVENTTQGPIKPELIERHLYVFPITRD